MSQTTVLPAILNWSSSSPLHHYFICDVFSAEPFQGNQLAVFTDGRPLAAAEMQALAVELHLAETVFLFPPDQDGDVKIRIFRGRTELPFAGHPVLGTAFIVGYALDVDRVKLETASGIVVVDLERADGQIRFGRMEQPIPERRQFRDQVHLLLALGVTSSRLPIESYSNGPTHVYVGFETEEEVRRLTPNLAALRDLEVGVVCFAGRRSSWKMRMFRTGVDSFEDAATGSAAGPLAVHLIRHGEIASGEEIDVYQGAEIGRPSQLTVSASVAGDRIESVSVGGAAVLVAEGHFRGRDRD